MMVAVATLGFNGCPETSDGNEPFATGDESTGDDGDGDGGNLNDEGDNLNGYDDPVGDLGLIGHGGELLSPIDETGDTGEMDDSCGDFGVQVDEECDGWNTNFESCLSLGFAGGQLACHDDCTFDVSDCFSAGCGNGIIEVDEICDGTPYPCWILGYGGSANANGLAPCLDDCTPDESACDAACEWGEPGCFCVATTPCPSGYECSPNPQFLANAPGTCEPTTCEMAGEHCGGASPSRGGEECCAGLECVGGLCL